MAIKNIVLGADNIASYVKATKQPVNAMLTTKRCPATLVIDVSGSMTPYQSLLKKITCELYQDILKDPVAKNIVELSIINFSSDVGIVQPLCEISSQEKQGADLEFQCGGLTLTGSALQAALLQLEQRIDQYRHSVPVIRHTAPLLFLVSDGKPEYTPEMKDDEEKAMAWSKNYIKEHVRTNKLSVIAVEIGNSCNHALMRELTGLSNDHHVLRVDNGTALADLFRFSSSLMVTCSRYQEMGEQLNEKDLRDYQHLEEL
jgi:uncharacterized protein YegL